MAVSVMTWGTKLVPGKAKPFTGIEDSDGVLLKITNACLGEKINDANGRTLVKITKIKSFLADSDSEDEEEEAEKKKEGKKDKKKKGGDDDEDDDEDSEDGLKTEEFILCSLIPGKIETVSLNVDFSSDLLSFEVIGNNEVHLLGNFIDTNGPETDSEMDMEDMEDLDLSLDGEDAHRLEDVSSDVEVTETRLGFEEDSEEESDAGRFEEITDKKSALKRSADAMDEDHDGPASTKSNGTASGELSKKQKKKLAKKLKNEAGEAVAVTASTTTVIKEEEVTTGDAKKEKKEGKKEKKEKTEGGAGAKRTTPSGLVIEDTKKGTGKEAKKGNRLSMRYVGKLTNGTVFDKNTGGKPFSFKLGAGEVIKGWDEGLAGMQIGGERVLTVPPELAYGKNGSKPEIPPNATLRFEVKLLEIK